MNILDKLPKPFFVLAPMDDVTDTVFRQIVDACAAPDVVFTEFVNVDGLMSPGRPKLLKKLRFAENEKNLVAQLWGLKPENFKAVAAQIADGSLAHELGLPKGCNFVGIDLNMGCPAKSEVQNGACSALIKLENRQLASDIIDATRAGLSGALPLSVKTRLGFSEVDMTWFEFLLGKNLDMLTVHGRTRKEMSKVPAHWDLIGQVRELRDKLAPATLLVGNGDVVSRTEGEALASQYGLDGIMIGRGIFHDPFVFAKDSPWPHYDKSQRILLYRKQVELFAKTWQNHERNIKTLNKFCKVYISDFDGAKELRERLMAAVSTDELLALLAAQSAAHLNSTADLTSV
jgi:tRNA-dihydrouridine synthase